MLSRTVARLVPTAALLMLPVSAAPVLAEGAGQADLDRATELKLSIVDARDLPKLNQAIELLDSAIDKGLDEAGAEFAREMLVASLLQRASTLSRAVLDRPVANPRQDPRWVQIRQFALTDLNRIVGLDDTQVEAHFLIARLQSLPLGDPNAARRSLTKVIASESEDLTDEQRAQAYALRGATQRDPKEQQADYTEATKLMPGKGEFHLLVGQALMRQEKRDEALAAVAKAEELSPENPAVYELKGMVLRGMEKLDEAVAAYDKASELRPEAVGPYQYRGEIYSLLGDNEKAIEQLSKAIELAPQNLASPLIRAQLYLVEEEFDKALADVESVLARQPGLVTAILMRGRILLQLGRVDEALAPMGGVARLASDQPEVQLQLAGLYMDAGKSERAAEALSRVIELTPDNALALRMRGDMRLAIGKHNEALADFAKSYELEPDNAGLLNNYAWTLATSPFEGIRNGERAVELATRACELTEYNAAHILSTLAASYAEAGDFDKAIEFAQKAVKTHAADTDKQRDMTDALAAELASYQAGKPWRELQQDGQLPGPDAEEEAEEEETPVVPLDF